MEGRAVAISSHERPNEGATNEWLTPPEIVKALGPFDLDPCSPVNRPWDTAWKHYTSDDDGLAQPWEGRVWLNPPYGPHAAKFLKKLAEHGNGIALTFARTETRAFFDHVWPRATALLFIEGRLFFHKPDGSRASMNAGAPSVLIAYGRENADRLRTSGIAGAYVEPASRTDGQPMQEEK